MIRLFSAMTVMTALAVGFSSVLVCPDTAVAKKRRSSRRGSSQNRRAQIQAQIRQWEANMAAAQRTLAIASQRGRAAQAVLQGAEGRLSSATGAIQNAKAAVAAATDEVERIAAEIEQAQGPDSELAVCKAALKNAQEDYQAASDRVFQAPDYKAEYQRVLQSPDRAKLLPKLRAEALAADTGVQQAKVKLEYAKRRYEQVRMGLVRDNPDWVRAVEAAKKARQQQTEAEQSIKGRALSRMSARAALREASTVAGSAKATIIRGQAELKKLRAAAKRTSTQRHSSSRSGSRR